MTTTASTSSSSPPPSTSMSATQAATTTTGSSAAVRYTGTYSATSPTETSMTPADTTTLQDTATSPDIMTSLTTSTTNDVTTETAETSSSTFTVVSQDTTSPGSTGTTADLYVPTKDISMTFDNDISTAHTTSGTITTATSKSPHTNVTTSTMASHPTIPSTMSRVSSTNQPAPLKPSGSHMSRTTTTTVLANRSTRPTSLLCPNPPEIPGGSTITSDPYPAGSTAVYSCFAGYVMSGAATMVCTSAGNWPIMQPQCLPAARNPRVDNNIQFGNGVPLWLAVLLGVVVVITCLLLLTCLILYCLRLCGTFIKVHDHVVATTTTSPTPKCWEGSILGGRIGRRVYGSRLDRRYGRGSRVASIVDLGQDTGDMNKRTGYSGTTAWMERDIADGGEATDRNQRIHNAGGGVLDRHVSIPGNGTAPLRHECHIDEPKLTPLTPISRPQMLYSGAHQAPLSTQRLGPRTSESGLKKKRIVAKRPTGRLWMPHAQQKRHINTSTQ